MAQLADNRIRLRELSHGAVAHASTFGWQHTTAGLLDTYRAAREHFTWIDLAATHGSHD